MPIQLNQYPEGTSSPKQHVSKVVEDLEAAIERIKNYTAPLNAMRLNKKTPCAKTSVYEECKGPERICNSWTITQKSFPKGRIKVVLINGNLGL